MLARNGRAPRVVALAGAIALLGSAWLVRAEGLRLQDAFHVQARIIHRLLSQQMVQHEAVLSTLTLLPSTPDTAIPLTAVYPHIRRVQLQAIGSQRQPIRLIVADWAAGHYTLTAAGVHSQAAMDIDLAQWVRPQEWPEPSADLPLGVELSLNQQVFSLQSQTPPAWGWELRVSKAIASDAQPFTVHTRTHLTWALIPWGQLVSWWLAVIALTWAGLAWRRQHSERLRVQALLRLDQVSRLGTLAEVGAGVAHEINQPLTAILANAQTAQRALKDHPPDTGLLERALEQTVQQARRASGVVTRLRSLLERPGERQPMRRIELGEVARHVLDLLSPGLQRLQVHAHLHAPGPVHVLADPVALEQIVHNLVQNALQSLEQVPASERHLALAVVQTPRHCKLTVTDSGTGIAPELLPRLFEPFVTTRTDGSGLGLGLTLCETLASHMGGTLRADHHAPRGALFELTLPPATLRNPT